MASSKDLNPPPSGSYFQKFSTVTEIIQIKSRIYCFVLSPTAVYKLIIPAITCQSSLTKRQWITFKLKWQQHIEAELKRMSSRIGDQIRQKNKLKTLFIYDVKCCLSQILPSQAVFRPRNGLDLNKVEEPKPLTNSIQGLDF